MREKKNLLKHQFEETCNVSDTKIKNFVGIKIHKVDRDVYSEYYQLRVKLLHHITEIKTEIYVLINIDRNVKLNGFNFCLAYGYQFAY